MNRSLSCFLPAVLMVLIMATGVATAADAANTSPAKRPNFLFIISDDQSWIHTGAAGYPVQTPAFDRLAADGMYFRNAYASAPTCTASRSAILAGQDFWRLGPAAQLWGDYPSSLPNYQRILADAGYLTGYTGKGWGPGKTDLPTNPAGPGYQQVPIESAPGLSKINYAENFRLFLESRKPGQPFSFWLSPTEPHRAYDTGIGQRNGIDPNALPVPGFLPGHPAVRSDIADYLYEIEWMDQQITKALQYLRESGEWDNTVIVYTSDNGMPFPRAKSNNYDYGVHIPLAIRWGGQKAKGLVIDDFVNLTDMAPTFLAMAGIPVPPTMNGKNLQPLLANAHQSGQFSEDDDAVFTGFQRHIGDARPGNVGYPARAIHTRDWLYIINFEPDRWPAGNPGQYADIDNGSPSKDAIRQLPELADFLELATAKRPAEELYDMKNDPAQLNNLAYSWSHYMEKRKLRDRLMKYLETSGDPQVRGQGALFDSYPYHGRPDVTAKQKPPAETTAEAPAPVAPIGPEAHKGAASNASPSAAGTPGSRHWLWAIIPVALVIVLWRRKHAKASAKS